VPYLEKTVTPVASGRFYSCSVSREPTRSNYEPVNKVCVRFTSAQQGHATSSVPRHALLYPLFGCIAYIRFISSLYPRL